MAQTELILPKMGESVAEATITKWLLSEGDRVEVDQSIVEIATDKVDSEIPSPVAGVLQKILFKEGETIAVGTAIALIGQAGDEPEAMEHAAEKPSTEQPRDVVADQVVQHAEPVAKTDTHPVPSTILDSGPVEKVSPADTVGTATDTPGVGAPRFHKGRFFSPLVRSIAEKEGVSTDELERLAGHGQNGRVTKQDLLAYLENRTVTQRSNGESIPAQGTPSPPSSEKAMPKTSVEVSAVPTGIVSGNDEIIEMDRMRKLIADHMVMSKHTSPHVTSYVEADVSPLVQWRDSVKDAFFEKEGEKITFTPVFVEALARAIRDFPMVNVSVDGTKIIVKKNINIGMAVALPNGNLIVPVIRNADRMNLYGLTKAVNDLALRTRENKLLPDEIQGGTMTLTNVGSFGNVMGTPIINQPQVAILATGIIQKKPVVVETREGDTIGIRHMMFLSLSYDHRVVDGALGGRFVRKVADYLEAFDVNREF